MTVHLVNLTNPMMMKGPLREVIPVGKQSVTVRLPKGTRPKRVQLLSTGSPVPVADNGFVLHLTLPSIDVHEVIAIDF
jgi:hypothetical protein